MLDTRSQPWHADRMENYAESLAKRMEQFGGTPPDPTRPRAGFFSIGGIAEGLSGGPGVTPAPDPLADPPDPPELANNPRHQAAREKVIRQLLDGRKLWREYSEGMKFCLWLGGSFMSGITTLFAIVFLVALKESRLTDPNTQVPVILILTLLISQVGVFLFLRGCDRDLSRQLQRLRSLPSETLLRKMEVRLRTLAMDYQAKAIAREMHYSQRY